jgi:hypothetical protein
LSFEIGKVLETQEPLILKIKDVVASRTYIASETRFGKSHTARRVVEEILENWVGQIGVIIVDPEGEYASLREKYPVLIIGRDVPIQVETPTLLASTAEFMAQQILETGTSVIIDLSVVEDVESGKDYVDKFLRRFFHLQTTAKKPYLVLWEEIEDFAPESGAPGTRTCLETAIAYARRGGKRGIGVIYVGHRPAWISKGILSQCPNKAIGRIESPDMKALEEYARIPRSIVERLIPKQNEKGEVTDQGPERGVFCFTGDWVQKTTFVKVGPVKTTHLGATPEIIPRPVGDIEGVIQNVRKALSQVIEKAKPVIASQTEIENKIKTELESKYKGKIETLERTAVERAERKYKVKIDELQLQLEKLSRSQAMQPTAPITDVLEHPIVKTRMLQLDEKARDLLTWIEREPGHTREELAARMVSSKDVIASLVDKINRFFQLQVVVDDGGRPIRYKSMLKRLFLTDVAKREIEELGHLQERNRALEEENKTLRPIAQQSATLRGEVEHARRVNKELAERLDKEEIDLKESKSRNEALTKENEAYRKIKEGFLALGITGPVVDIEKRLDAFRKEIAPELQQILDRLAQEGQKVTMEIDTTIENKVKAEVAQLAEKGALLTAQKEVIDLEHKDLVVDVHHAGEEHVQMTTETDKGKILYCAKEYLSKDADGKPKDTFSWSELKQALIENGWSISDPTVSARLTDLAREGRLIKLEKGGYRLPTKVKFNIERDVEARAKI